MCYPNLWTRPSAPLPLPLPPSSPFPLLLPLILPLLLPLLLHLLLPPSLSLSTLLSTALHGHIVSAVADTHSLDNADLDEGAREAGTPQTLNIAASILVSSMKTSYSSAGWTSAAEGTCMGRNLGLSLPPPQQPVPGAVRRLSSDKGWKGVGSWGGGITDLLEVHTASGHALVDIRAVAPLQWRRPSGFLFPGVSLSFDFSL
ncbi:uncharacterized protein EV422DRAFT_534414 [Fimicolochytrium jonesii]|uniref:uncharacterized protein n=1 Tax=Fimicolochytrium jonesii TaxID=1396493 RepID=UPI0022FF328A|nr:uncharacterized protein EV422DRAFT_534414 [Fimicolochytrium jonesii]KAI8819349.1 hypothetical protein EV422DRAFT_534414 [Fimicolochytrium jonesii]